MKAWHFIQPNKKLRFHPFSEIIAGKTLTHIGGVSLCASGLHASLRACNALSFLSWPDAWICRVELSGGIIYGGDKLVAENRKCLWMIPADDLLWEWACCCAEDVLHIANDPRSNAAIDARRSFQIGAITADELAAARAAAWDAARDAQNNLLEQIIFDAATFNGIDWEKYE